jgi:hypothetical protein
MDKVLKRQIAYKPATKESFSGSKKEVPALSINPLAKYQKKVEKKHGAQANKPVKIKKAAAKKVEVKKPDTNLNKKVVDWFNSHPLISNAGVCGAASISPSNFFKDLKAGRIPEHHLPKLVAIIKNYGFENK